MRKIKEEYYIDGYLKYNNGCWFFAESEKWSLKRKTISLKGEDLIKFAKKVEEQNIELRKKIIENGKVVFKFPDKPPSNNIVTWLSKNEEIQVKGPIAVCLKHFSESQKEAEYNIITSMVGNNMIVNIQNTSQTGVKTYSTWFFINSRECDICYYELPVYAFAFPDIVFDSFTVDNSVGLKIKDNLKHFSSLLKSHHFKHKLTIKLTDKNKKIYFSSESTIYSYNKGLLCGCIPIPGKQNKKKKGAEHNIVKTPEMVVTSPNVVDALEYLSQVWQDNFATSVLISAPPGSGKENFSHSIAYGTGRLAPDEEVSKYTISFASGEKTELERKLYGEIKKGIWNEVVDNSLIDEPEGKVIFLDEVHHPENEAGIRASLLRPLESREYEPNGAKEPIKIRDLLFILATSKPLKVRKKGEKCLNDIPPPDFWTRMTHVVIIKHPFEGIWDKTFPDIIDHYFLFFWWDRLENYFQIDPETNNPLEEGAVNKVKHKHRLAQMEKLKDDKNDNKNLKKLAELFRERLISILQKERIQPYQLSIRGFRNIVTRLFSISAAEISQGHGFDPNKLEKQIDPVIYEILGIATLDP